MAQDRDDPDFEKFASEARAYAASKTRERTAETRFGSTRTARPPRERADDPLKAHERHEQEHGPDQVKRLRIIADPGRRDHVRTKVAEHYKAWGIALNKAHYRRYDDSERIYQRKLTEQKRDERLIPAQRKDDLRKDAIREAVAQSKNRIEDINASMPRMIDRAIDSAVKLTPRSKQNAPLDSRAQRAKDTAAAYNARARNVSHDRDRER